MPDFSLILSCEHASNHIPKEYISLFKHREQVLTTHRALDIGAQNTFKRLASKFECNSIAAKNSRLLIDLNRSLHHQSVFSEFSKKLSKSDRQKLIDGVYLPYRKTIEKWIKHSKKNIHISIHSFTPSLNGEVRNNDIGLLYDPKRPLELIFSKAWKSSIKIANPTLKTRMNHPYRGTSDGLTAALRKIKKPSEYIGIELEINQKHFFSDGRPKAAIIIDIIHSLKSTLEAFNSWNV